MAVDLKLIVILILNFFLSATYSMPFSIFPKIAIEKGVSLEMVGIIFSLFPLGSIIPSLIFAKMMKVWGRVKLLVLTSVLLGIATFLFGAIIYFEDQTAFITVAIISRIIQGMACGGFCTVAYAIIALLYRDSFVKKQTLMVFSFTMGVGIGPIIGGGLYELVNYEFANYTFAAISFLSIPAVFLIPSQAEGKSVNEKTTPENGVKNENEKNQKESVKLTSFLLNSRYSLTLGLIIINFSGFTFIYVSLEEHLKLLGSGPIMTGIFIAELTMSYFISMIVLNYLPKRVDRRTWLILGTIIEFISFFLVGPEPYLGLSGDLMSFIMIGIGICLCGFGGGLSILPILPELLDIGTYHITDDKEAIGDVASASNNIGFQIGEFLGPLLGGFLGGLVGFGHGASIFSGIILIYLAVYFIFGRAYEAFSSKRRASSANIIFQLKNTEMSQYKKEYQKRLIEDE